MKTYITLSAISAISLAACAQTPPPPICDRAQQVWDKFDTVEDVCEVQPVPVPFFTPFTRTTGPSGSSNDNDSSGQVQNETDVRDETSDGNVESDSESGVQTPVVPTPVVPIPVVPTPVVPTPVDPTPTPVDPTPTPVDPTPTPVDPTPTPVDPTPTPVDPVDETDSGVDTETETSEPADPTPTKPGPPPGFDDP